MLCKKVNLKLHALARMSKFMNTEKLRMIMKAFIESQFGYCPLVWMFHSRTLNNKINRLHWVGVGVGGGGGGVCVGVCMGVCVGVCVCVCVCMCVCVCVCVQQKKEGGKCAIMCLLTS